jgi:enoyl-CoA hydratase
VTKAPEVIIRTDGAVGRISLNRPAALNALTLGMCRTMTQALLAWAVDPAIRLVMLDHAEGRGFCAGGDIRTLADSLAEGDDFARSFFREEYQLDHLLFAYPKPTVVFMDGVVMGGGSGVAMPCRFRIATEACAFAMPETGIGLFPDVGGGWFLSRLTDKAGRWMALTGARVDAANCLVLGLATHFAPASDLAALKAQIIANPDAIEAILENVDGGPGEATFPTIRAAVGRAFAGPTVEAILAALAQEDDWGTAQAAAIRQKSPLMQKVALRQLIEGARHTSFAQTLAMEFRIAAHLIGGHDFKEGVRALILDKDNAPKWSPGRLEEVDDRLVDAAFSPLPPAEEWTPLEPVLELHR